MLLNSINSPADLRKLPIEALPCVCSDIRAFLIDALSRNPGHFASSLGAVELTVALHRVFSPERDRIVFDVGHQCYCHKMLTGRNEAMEALRTFGRISGFPKPGESVCDAFTVGHASTAVSAAVGMALAGKMDKAPYRVYTLLGDGEIQEGQVWEASMLAGHRKLDNLVVIVDNNGLQIDGKIEDVCSPYPIDKKFEAFNFHVINVDDGNDMDKLRAAFEEAKTVTGKPVAIIAKTVKGKGVSFMEHQASWHGTAPNDEQYATAMADLEKVGEALCQK